MDALTLLGWLVLYLPPIFYVAKAIIDMVLYFKSTPKSKI